MKIILGLGLAAATSSTDAAVHKKMFGSGMRLSDLAKQTTSIISNKEMNNIMKIIKSVEVSGLLTKVVCETFKNETKERKVEFLSILLGTSDDSLLGNLLAGKGKISDSEATIRAGEGTIRAGQDS